jgi:hypothetical protein
VISKKVCKSQSTFPLLMLMAVPTIQHHLQPVHVNPLLMADTWQD